MAVITYEELQKRIDYLQQVNYDLPNAFYPTCFVKAQNDIDVDAQVKWQEELVKNKPGVPIETSLKTVIENENKKETFFGVNVLEDDQNLALLEKVEGEAFKFMRVPYSSKGGVLDTGVTNDLKLYENRLIKLTFKVVNHFEIYAQLLKWKEDWASSKLTHRYLKTKFNEEASSEGYLGLSYIHINSEGKAIPTAHLSLFGLIPTEVGFINGGIGPGTTPSTLKVTLTCIIASGLFLIALDEENYTYFPLI